MSDKSAPSPSGTEQSNLVLLGRIGAAHGIRGEVRIQSFTENPLDITKFGPLSTNKPGLLMQILKARTAKTVLIATLKDVNDRNGAEALNGVELFVPRTALPEIEDEDDFYYSDLIGLAALLEDGTVFGQVRNVVNYGAGDILEVTQIDGQVALLPFTKKAAPKVSLKDGSITIILPDEIVVEGEQERTDDREPDLSQPK